MTATDPGSPRPGGGAAGLAQFPLVAALLGRRRRFALGDEILDGRWPTARPTTRSP